MIVRDGPLAHLTYCQNVHPGESWAANRAAIEEHALAIRNQVAPGRAFGLGLRLGRTAADELGAGTHMDDLHRLLDEHDLYVFTINGFPYGPFHGTPVKERVYAPDWRSPERLAYTTSLADLLAALLPEETPGSISTVPGSYRAWIRTDTDRDAIACNLAACAEHLAAIEADTGRCVVLALEPEPDCLVDTTADTVDFFNVFLARHPAIRKGPADWRRYVGICLDACHTSVQFEDPAAALHALRRNGIRVPKVHLSAALRASAGPETAQRLTAFADETYLHQVRLRTQTGSLRTWPDLTAEAIEAVRGAKDAEVRVHVHVPLYWTPAADPRSTADDLSPVFFDALAEIAVPHLEIETYTFHILPGDLANLPLDTSIAREYTWVLDRIDA